MALREILARFGVEFDDKQLKTGGVAVEGMIGTLKGLAGFLVGPLLVGGIIEMTKQLAEQADVLAKQSVVLGLSTEELQQWDFAAKLSGSSAEEFNGALTKFNRNVFEASIGTKAQADAFKLLGVSIKDSAGNLRKPTQLIDDVADGLGKIEDPAKRTAIVMDLFGRSGARLLPLLKQGSAGMAKLRAEVEALGGGITEEFAKQSEEMNDNLTRMDVATRSLKVQIANALLPVLSRMAIGAARIIASLSRWVHHIKEVVGKSNLLKASLTWLSTGGLMHLFKLIGGWKTLVRWFGTAVAVLGRFLFELALPVLLIDELITTFEGGDTLIRRALDSMFGPGTTQQIVDWIKGIIEQAKKFLSDGVQAFKDLGLGIEDVKVALEILAFGVTATWTAIKLMEGGAIALKVALWLWQAACTAVSVAQWALNSGMTVGEALMWAQAGAAAAVEAAWAPVLVTLAAVAAAYAAISQGMQLVSEAGGAGGLWSGVKSLVTEGDFFKGVDQYQNQQARENANQQAGASLYPTKAEIAANGANMSSAPDVTNISVNVPPGTPEAMASRTAKAVSGALDAHRRRATKAALAQGAR